MRRFVLLLAAIGLGLWSVPAWAHDTGPPPLHLSPGQMLASLLAGTLGIAALVGIVVYRTLAKPAPDSAAARWSSRALYGVFAFIALLGGLVYLTRRELYSPEHALRGSQEHVSEILTEQAETLPESDRKAFLLARRDAASPGLRAAVAEALSTQTGADVSDALDAGFRDLSSSVREAALESLLLQDRARGLPLLLAALHDENTQIRELASLRLATLAGQKDGPLDKRLVPALLPSLTDSSPILVLNVMVTLTKLTGQNWRIRKATSPAERAATVRKWQDWWKANEKDWPTAPQYANITPILPTRTEPVPAFRLTDLDGKAITPETLRGKITLLNFWGTWCGPCLVELPGLIALHKEWQGRDIEIIGVAVGEQDGPEELRRWCKAHAIFYRQALANAETQEVFGQIEAVPVTVLLDGDGKIRRRWEGPQDRESFHNAVENVQK